MSWRGNRFEGQDRVPHEVVLREGVAQRSGRALFVGDHFVGGSAWPASRRAWAAKAGAIEQDDRGLGAAHSQRGERPDPAALE